MLSFKSIAGFLKKVSSSSRDDASKDAKQKSGAEGGAGSGAGGYGGSTSTHSSTGAGASVGWSGSTSEGATSARGTPANRTAGLGFPGASGGKKSDDANFIESPLFGMPSAFGDNSMFASSSILKGLPQNTSTQDVLRHLQRVVQQRSDELQQQEDAAAAAAAAKADAEDLNREAAVDAESRSAVTTTTGATARNSLDRVSPRPSHHQVSTAAPSAMDVSPVNTTAARTGTNATGDTSTTTSPAAVSREDMRHLQRIRGEMIDALDLCLQEVPDNTPQVGAAGGPAGLTEEDRARLEKLAGGGGGRAQPESLTRSNSVVLPSSFTNGMSAMVGAVADGAAAWEESRHIHNASPCGLNGDVGTATPRNTSIVATPVEAAETSTAAVPGPHTPAAGASSVSPTVFTHYEWRCLLLQVVEVIVRIDRIAMHEVRRRAMEKLAPGVIVPLPNIGGTNGGTTEYRWQLLSQVLPAHHKPLSTAPPSSSLTPTRHTQQQQQQVNVSAATAAALLNSPHLMMSRSEALLRTPDDAESLTLPIPATLITVASGQATPKDSPLPPNATATSTTATGTALPSPVAKMKHALVESGVLSPDNRVDYAISKEDKKLLEELITVACSLATWAIIKAILRHHQQAILSSRQRSSRRAAAASSAGGDTAATAAMLAANAPAGTSERAVLEMSLSATTAELAGTGNSAASLSGGRPPLVPPPVGAHPSPSLGLEEMGDDAAAAMATAKKNASDEVDDVPYIDWAAVVQELDGWMGGSPGHIVAECTLCASFLRDDGREMVMCMLQKPKPRHLLSNIHRHSEKLRHTDPTVLVAAAPVPPTASPRVPATAQGGSSGASGTSATGASSSAASPSAPSPSGSSSTAPPSPSATTNPAGSGGAASTAATGAGGGTPAASSAANVLPPSPTGSKTNPAVSTTVQAMIDDPTLVMDDLVAQLELVYRQAVGDTWSNFLEGAIESEIHSMQPAKTTAFGAAGVPTAYGDKTGNDEEGVSHSPCTTTTTTTYSEEPLPKQQSAQSLPSTTSAPSSPLTKAYITDTKTLCRLATAYFFGSDTWSERKRERRFALLYRSMRSRTERYSESAATRRSIRRGTSSAASPTQTATTTAVVSPVVATPMGDSSSPPAAPPPSSLPSQASRGSLGTASVLVPPSTNARASPSLPCTSPPTTVPAMAGGVGSAVLTPMKFSVEDTSSRAPGTTTAATAAAAASGTSSSPQPQQTATSRHSVLNTQLVAHQLCSSNASNAAVSTQSTPMTASLQISRDGGASETDVASGTYHVDGTAPHPTHESGSERYAMGQADQYATWTPFGFMMTSSANTTPPPEQEQSCGQLPQQQQQRQSSVTATPLRSDGDSNVASFAGVSHGLPGPFYNGVAPSNTEAVPQQQQQQQQQQPTAQSTAPTSTVPVGHPLSSIVLERIVNMSWSAALHKRGEQCLNAKPPRLEEAEQNAQEERLVAGAFGEFRARQRSLVSLINARLASGKSVEALMNAQKHFRFEKKDWTSHNQTIFSALRYLQSMVLLVRAQAACRVYGAVIETVQLVLPQATLCEQMLQVLAPRPRRDCIIRFADCRSKLLRSYVYLLKECWLAHAAFNDHGKAAKYFSQCVQVLQMLRRRARESELFAAYMERGSQLMKMKNYKKSVEIFKLAVNIAKKSLQDAGTAAASSGSAGSTAPSASVSLGSTMTNMAGIVSAATAGLNVKLGNGGNGSGAPTSASAVGSASTPSQQFHRNLHFRGAGSGQLYTAEEHSVGTSMATADDMEFTWRVAESERMLALSYVTEAEHEVNVRERREELSNAVSNAYSSQRSLQRWQTKGGTPKRLLTAVPCSLIVICKGLLLLNQARKAALLLEPLIENKPSSALVRPPMWREILDPTEDPYTAEDVVLRTYVCSVKIAVYMLYSRCLAEFDGERALRAVTQVDQLLQESDAWIYAIRTQLRRALEEVRMKDKSVTTLPTTPCTARNLELPRVSAAAVSTLIAKTAVAAAAANEDNEDALSTTPQGGGGNETVVSAASTTGTTAALPSAAAPAAAAAASTKTTEVPPLRISNVNIPHSTATNNSNNNNASASSYSTTTAAASSTAAVAAAATEGDAARTPPYTGGHRGPDYNSPEEAPLRQRRFNVTGMAGSVNSIAPSRDDLLRDEDEPSRQSTLMQTSAGSVNVDPWNCGNAHLTGAYPTPPASTRSPRTQQSPRAPTLRIHMESTSECMTALFALREGKSHIRKALRDIFIVSGDAHSLIKNWEEALKSYSHALVISMGEVEAANAAAQSRRQVNSHYATPRNAQPSPRTSNVGGTHEDCNSATTSHIATGAASASHHATAGSGGSGRNNGGGGATSTTTTNTNNNNNNNNHHGGSASDTRGGGATTTRAARGSSSSSAQCWGQVVPLDEEFFLWDEEDVLIADNMLNRDLTSSTAAKDLRAVVADEERMDSRACESLVLSKLANVYRALDKPTTAIHYHNLVLDYANECNDKLLAYNSMLSLARLYTAACSQEEARESWAKVSDLAKDYEDKEVSRETKRNIVVGQEAAGMYLDVVKTAEELEKLATGEEGEDAAADRRFALEALANANLQLGQYDACIAALDNREKVQEKSAEWNGRLLSMRAKARMGLNKPTDAIKVMQSWAVKARNLGNWVELGKANSALSAAYASENQNMQARHYHEATLNAFALAETLSEDCQHIALDSARWLVHYAYLDDATVQVDPALTFTGGCLTSDSEASGGDFRYTDSGLCNSSGDLGEMLAKEEELRRSSSSLIADGLRGRISDRNASIGDDDDNFFGSGGSLSNHSLFGMHLPALSDADAPEVPPPGANVEEGEAGQDASAAASTSATSSSENTSSGSTGEAGEGAENEEEDGMPLLQRHSSSAFHPKDPSCDTAPPSLAASVNRSMHEDPTQQDTLELNYSGSSAGQSEEVGDSDAVAEEIEDEARRRREVDEALRTMDEDADTADHPSEVAAAVAAAAQNNMFFRMGKDFNAVGDDGDGDDAADANDPTSLADNASGKAPSKTASAPPTPNITTAAAKPSTSAAAAGGTKSASSNYVPPPTALANVSICSRPAAAAAGTDVLEMPVDVNRSASEPTSGSGPSGTGSPLSAGTARGSGGFGNGRNTAAAAASAAAARLGGEEGHLERKPATVRTTYYRGALEMMETAAQLLLVPRSVSRMVVPYSPAEAVDLALLSHPHSLFVFYFAEYTTEYGAQCDVVVRPPGTAGFLKLRTQISLKEYHSKDVVNALLTTISADISVAGDRTTAGTTTTNTIDPGASLSHPFVNAMAKAGAAGGSSSAGASPTLANVRPDALRAALDDETRSCLRNLHADAWQPIIDRMHREKVSYQDADTVIIMPDIALLHLPFAGLLPSPDYGGEDAPLGEQFTLVVTPSLSHFVYHGMSKPHPHERTGGVLDPRACRYIFVPYAAAGVGAPPFTAGSGCSSLPSSPRPRQPATSQSAKSTTATTATGGGGGGKLAPSGASPSPWPSVSAAQSIGDSTLTPQTSATAAGSTATGAARRESALGAASDGAASSAADACSFEDLLKTWKVHRGCTRKELIHAFTDCRTRALMFLGPMDQGGVRVADGVVTMQDITQSLLQARSLQASQGSNAAGGAAPPQLAPSSLSIPLPPLCTHMDLLVLTADRGLYPTVTNGGMAANLCMSLGVHRVLRLNIVHGLAPSEEHYEFIANFCANLQKVARWSLTNPYAVALRTTIAEARVKGMSSNTWGAFTLMGSA